MKLIPITLPTQTYSAGSRNVVSLRDLPKMLMGRFFHVVKFTLALNLAPTFGSGTVPLFGEHQMFTALDFFDGTINRFVGGLNDVRCKERMENGGVPRLADPDEGATTVNRYWKRVLHVGPRGMANPTDHVLPAGCLENGEFRLTHGALADLGSTTSNVSAATGSLRIIAWGMLADEFHIPPAYQWGSSNLTASEVNLTGRAMYLQLALLNSATHDAITAGDFENVRLDMGQGDIIQSVNVGDLNAGFVDEFGKGEFGSNVGEPEGAEDDNPKIVNRTTPTALAASLPDLAPLLWVSPGEKLTKQYAAESSAKLRWDGSQTTAKLVYGRVLSQSPAVIAGYATKAIGRLGREVKFVGVKTIKGKKYTGPFTEYMPHVVKV